MKKENKYTYLIKNIGLLMMSNFGTKILSFLLIPLYTSILTTEEYGIYDVCATTISLLIPILTMNIVSAVLRFSMEKEKENRKIFSIALRCIFISILIVCILIGINNTFHIIKIFEDFWLFFLLLFTIEIVYNLFSNFARGLEKINDVAVAGMINSVSMLLFNILMLTIFKIGLAGYFISNILGYFFPSIYLYFKLHIWKYVSLKTRDKGLEVEMKEYSKPMIFNTIGWWITNVSDRYIVTWICGVSENGIYSVAYKIPSILNIFQTIFNQAWTLSAVKENENDNGDFYTDIYKLYNLGLVIVCSVLIIFDKIIARILFAKNFYAAWKYAPFLMISVIFGALSGLLEGVFIANKNTRIIARTTIIGSLINIIFNVILVSTIGPIGAAIATLIAYIVVWGIRVRVTNKIITINVSYIRNVITYIFLIFQAIVLLFIKNNIILYFTELILFLTILFIYKKEIIQYTIKAFRIVKKQVK